MIVVTKDGRRIECSRITWDFNPGMDYVRLYCFRTEEGTEYEYEYDNVAIHRVIEILEKEVKND